MEKVERIVQRLILHASALFQAHIYISFSPFHFVSPILSHSSQPIFSTVEKKEDVKTFVQKLLSNSQMPRPVYEQAVFHT